MKGPKYSAGLFEHFYLKMSMSYRESWAANVSLLPTVTRLARSTSNTLLSLHATISCRPTGTLWARQTFIRTHQNGKIRQRILDIFLRHISYFIFSTAKGSDWFPVTNNSIMREESELIPTLVLIMQPKQTCETKCMSLWIKGLSTLWFMIFG